MGAIKTALVGLGKIAADQHVPVLRSLADTFELVATADPVARLPEVRSYLDFAQLLESERALTAVSICTPPQLRVPLARLALEHDCHVLLEKPPATRVEEAEALLALAAERKRVIFAAWHSRFAAGVEFAHAWLQTRRVLAVRIHWLEDVRVWHPGQEWIWRAGGFGVFDAGINAFSILTRLLSGVVVREAELNVPVNCETPISATLYLASAQTESIAANLDFLHAGPPRWDIEVDTDDGLMQLSSGGAVLNINAKRAVEGADAEYRALYQHFAALINEGRADMDVAPLRVVTDALRCGRRNAVAAFPPKGCA